MNSKQKHLEMRREMSLSLPPLCEAVNSCTPFSSTGRLIDRSTQLLTITFHSIALHCLQSGSVKKYIHTVSYFQPRFSNIITDVYCLRCCSNWIISFLKYFRINARGIFFVWWDKKFWLRREIYCEEWEREEEITIKTMSRRICSRCNRHGLAMK